MKTSRFARALVAAFAVAAPGTALAYVGPGVGLGAIAAFFGAVLAVLLAVVGVIWYPIKRLLGRNKPAATGGKETEGKP